MFWFGLESRHPLYCTGFEVVLPCCWETSGSSPLQMRVWGMGLLCGASLLPSQARTLGQGHEASRRSPRLCVPDPEPAGKLPRGTGADRQRFVPRVVFFPGGSGCVSRQLALLGLCLASPGTGTDAEMLPDPLGRQRSRAAPAPDSSPKEDVNAEPPSEGKGAARFGPSAGVVDGESQTTSAGRCRGGDGVTAACWGPHCPGVPLTSLAVGDRAISRTEMTEFPLLSATELGVLGDPCQPVDVWAVAEVTARRL